MTVDLQDPTDLDLELLVFQEQAIDADVALVAAEIAALANPSRENQRRVRAAASKARTAYSATFDMMLRLYDEAVTSMTFRHAPAC